MMTHMFWLLLVTTSLLVVPVYSNGWMNNWDYYGSDQCSSTSFMYQMSSYHNNRKEDRRFAIGCRGLPVSVSGVSCHWTGPINEYDAVMDKRCPNNGWVIGMQSDHKSRFEDRIFELLCCSGSGYKLQNCYRSSWANWWDAKFDYTVPSGSVLVGMYSEHSNKHEDRRFKFYTCEMKRK